MMMLANCARVAGRKTNTKCQQLHEEDVSASYLLTEPKLHPTHS